MEDRLVASPACPRGVQQVSPSYKNGLTHLKFVPILFSFALVRARPARSEARLVYAFDTLGYSKRLRDAGVQKRTLKQHESS
jgi:hypothetical protein